MTHNVTKIFIGKTRTPRWRRWLRTGVVEELQDGSGDIDVYLIQGRDEGRGASSVPKERPSISWYGDFAAAVVVAVSFLLAAWFARLRVAEANVVMVFLAAVAWVAFRYGRGPAVWASVMSVLVFDVFFVPPVGSLTVKDSQYLITFAVLLVIGLLISTLTARLRTQLRTRPTAGTSHAGLVPAWQTTEFARRRRVPGRRCRATPAGDDGRRSGDLPCPEQ